MQLGISEFKNTSIVNYNSILFSPKSLVTKTHFEGLKQFNEISKKSVLSLESQHYLEQFKKQYDFQKLKPVQWRVKRCSDYIGATVGLMLAAPIMFLSAIAIKLESKGPVIFKQKRLGQDGKPFTFYKFRGMYDSAPKTLFKIDPNNDKNITRVGKVLRKYSLDELPQLINMLKGDMSLIGPRPDCSSEAMIKLDPNSVRRLAVRPGARLNYKNIIKDENLQKKIATEKEYLENWSLLSDFMAMCQILKVMVTGRNY